MGTINRSARLVKPAQPFLEWLHRVDPTSAHLTLGDLALEPTVYLLPEWETEEEALQRLAEISNEIFEEQLAWLVPCSVRLACRAGPARVSSIVVLVTSDQIDRVRVVAHPPFGCRACSNGLSRVSRRLVSDP